jgi:dihydroxyacetone kinase
VDQEIFKNSVLEACRRVIDAEQRITECDSLVGDGDCGITLARGAKAVSEYIESLGTSDDAVKEVMALTDVLESSMDGTSGAIYGIFFAGLASELRKAEAGFLTSRAWTLAAVGALNVLQDATPAREGDRTLMDALIPFVQALGANKSFSQAVAAARAGVKATKGMRASLGRSVYVEESAWSLVPDPGAEGVLCILEGLGNVLAPAIQT